MKEKGKTTKTWKKQVWIIKISHIKHIKNRPIWDFSRISKIVEMIKIRLNKCLIDGSFKIFNNWNSFHKDIENIKSYLIKNVYPLLLIDKLIKFSSNQNQLRDTFDVYYFKLPYIGNFLHHIKNKLSKLCKECCKENFNIKLVSRSFKIKIIFHIKTQFLVIWNFS